MLRMSSVTVHVLSCQTICKTRNSFIEPAEICLISSPVRLLIQKLFCDSDEGFKITLYVAPETRYLHSIQIWRVIRWPFSLLKLLRTVVVEALLRYMHLC